MGDTTDLTIEILKQIRDGVVQTNARLDQTREELGARLDRVVQEQVRQSTAIADLQGTQRAMVDALGRLGDRIDHMLTGPLG